MSTRPKWKPYTREEVAELSTTAAPPTSKEERLCPACGQRAVRRYYHEMDGGRRGHPVGMSYTWCSNCHRYTSSTGVPRSSLYDFDDPSDGSDALARLRREDLIGLLDHLDALWDSGVLPQEFTLRKKRSS